MNKEREKSILEMLLKYKKVSVRDLEKALFASESSIRRDLADLERQNLIKRVHGGAVLEENSISSVKIPFVIRELEQSAAKQTIARKAAEKVRDNDVIFLDGSSSAYNLIPFLAGKKNLTVITNGIKALLRLGEYKIKTVSTGGDMISSCFVLVGADAVRSVEAINADAVFFSCRGLSYDGYLSDISKSENIVRQKMIAQSEHAYLLCASEKFGHKYFHNLCHISEIDKVISEKDLPEKFRKD